ncbi:hypothetical protein GUITHDRAFT_100684 [Guillardia theta CCMP2712]|uniref:Retinol dehydrogenase 12 n=1 Tax=Guillardia theta (strain CCMP2712) TaxID=905079 RepID=L1JZC3_GUITC|nr:hypothetical protein GUITHDRAFT_100684 [Guillardia theta CCMP2712]EKX53712.1 hypothetical protein GUITHDRAFT_100684 [Guillardia theta CCMP2712]|eukprot:XP_005840692.1 hypothetical protein GUITHDRAFT_100684 [Guillardia theta CCMP2712]
MRNQAALAMSALQLFTPAMLAVGIFLLKSIISPTLGVVPVDMTGQVVIVTGGNSGCGLETVRMLAGWNATVIMACRDEKRGEMAAKDVRSSLSPSSKGEVLVWKLDLESFDSIRTFAQKFRASGMQLNVLINNAGVRYHALEITQDGIELHYQRRMKESVEGVYGDTKLMQVVISREMDRRLSEYGINSYAVHPGEISHLSAIMLQTFLVLTRPLLARDPMQGAMTQVYAATSRELEGRGGLYLDNCKVATASTLSQDAALAKWLWNTSMDLISV